MDAIEFYNAPQTSVVIIATLQAITQRDNEHGAIIRTGITCKKIPCYMRGSAWRWFVVKKAKMFGSYVKHF